MLFIVTLLLSHYQLCFVDTNFSIQPLVYCYITSRFEGVSHSSPAISLDTSAEDKPSSPTAPLSNADLESTETQPSPVTVNNPFPPQANDHNPNEAPLASNVFADAKAMPTNMNKTDNQAANINSTPYSSDITPDPQAENLVTPFSADPISQDQSLNDKEEDAVQTEDIKLTSSAPTLAEDSHPHTHSLPQKDNKAENVLPNSSDDPQSSNFAENSADQQSSSETKQAEKTQDSNNNTDPEPSSDNDNHKDISAIPHNIQTSRGYSMETPSFRKLSYADILKTPVIAHHTKQDTSVIPHEIQTSGDSNMVTSTLGKPTYADILKSPVIADPTKKDLSAMPQNVKTSVESNTETPNDGKPTYADVLKSPVIADLTKEVSDLSDMIKNREWVVGDAVLKDAEVTDGYQDQKLLSDAESASPSGPKPIETVDVQQETSLDDSLETDTPQTIPVIVEEKITKKRKDLALPTLGSLGSSTSEDSLDGTPGKSLPEKTQAAETSLSTLGAMKPGLSNDSLDDQIAAPAKDETVHQEDTVEPTHILPTLQALKGTLSADSLDGKPLSRGDVLPTIASVKTGLSNDSLDDNNSPFKPAKDQILSTLGYIQPSLSTDSLELAIQPKLVTEPKSQDQAFPASNTVGFQASETSQKLPEKVDGLRHLSSLSAVESILSSGSTDEPMDTLDESLDLSKYGNGDDGEYSDDFLSDDDPYAPSASSSSSTIYSTDTLDDRMAVLKEEEELVNEPSLMDVDGNRHKNNNADGEANQMDIGDETDNKSVPIVPKSVFALDSHYKDKTGLDGAGNNDSPRHDAKIDMSSTIKDKTLNPMSALGVGIPTNSQTNPPVPAFQLQAEYDGPLLEIYSEKLDANTMHMEYDTPVCRKRGTDIEEVLPEAILIAADDDVTLEPKIAGFVDASDIQSDVEILQKDFDEVRDLLETASVALEAAIENKDDIYTEEPPLSSSANDSTPPHEGDDGDDAHIAQDSKVSGDVQKALQPSHNQHPIAEEYLGQVNATVSDVLPKIEVTDEQQVANTDTAESDSTPPIDSPDYTSPIQIMTSKLPEDMLRSVLLEKQLISGDKEESECLIEGMVDDAPVPRAAPVEAILVPTTTAVSHSALPELKISESQGDTVTDESTVRDLTTSPPSVTFSQSGQNPTLPEEKLRSAPLEKYYAQTGHPKTTGSDSDSLDGIISSSFIPPVTNSQASAYQFANSQSASNTPAVNLSSAENVANEIVQSVLMDTLSYLHSRSALHSAVLSVDTSDSMDDARSTPSSERRSVLQLFEHRICHYCLTIFVL